MSHPDLTFYLDLDPDLDLTKFFMSSFGCPSYTHTKGSVVVVVVVGDHPGPYPQLQAHIYLLQHQVLMQPRWPNRKISSSVADLDPIGSTSFASLSDK